MRNPDKALRRAPGTEVALCVNYQSWHKQILAGVSTSADETSNSSRAACVTFGEFYYNTNKKMYLKFSGSNKQVINSSKWLIQQASD